MEGSIYRPPEYTLLYLTSEMDMVDFFRPLTFPNLEFFSFEGHKVRWPRSNAFFYSSFQAGLQQLDIEDISTEVEIDVGKLLQETPSLNGLTLPDAAKFNEETKAKLVEGDLGPCLERLFVGDIKDVKTFLDMVEARTDNAIQQQRSLLKMV